MASTSMSCSVEHCTLPSTSAMQVNEAALDSSVPRQPAVQHCTMHAGHARNGRTGPSISHARSCVGRPHLLELHLAGVGGGAVVQGLAGDAVRALLLHALRAGRPVIMRRLHRLPARRPLAHPRLQLLRPRLQGHAALFTKSTQLAAFPYTAGCLLAHPFCVHACRAMQHCLHRARTWLHSRTQLAARLLIPVFSFCVHACAAMQNCLHRARNWLHSHTQLAARLLIPVFSLCVHACRATQHCLHRARNWLHSHTQLAARLLIPVFSFCVHAAGYLTRSTALATKASLLRIPVQQMCPCKCRGQRLHI